MDTFREISEDFGRGRIRHIIDEVGRCETEADSVSSPSKFDFFAAWLEAKIQYWYIRFHNLFAGWKGGANIYGYVIMLIVCAVFGVYIYLLPLLFILLPFIIVILLVASVIRFRRTVSNLYVMYLSYRYRTAYFHFFHRKFRYVFYTNFALILSFLVYIGIGIFFSGTVSDYKSMEPIIDFSEHLLLDETIMSAQNEGIIIESTSSSNIIYSLSYDLQKWNRRLVKFSYLRPFNLEFVKTGFKYSIFSECTYFFVNREQKMVIFPLFLGETSYVLELIVGKNSTNTYAEDVLFWVNYQIVDEDGDSKYYLYRFTPPNKLPGILTFRGVAIGVLGMTFVFFLLSLLWSADHKSSRILKLISLELKISVTELQSKNLFQYLSYLGESIKAIQNDIKYSFGVYSVTSNFVLGILGQYCYISDFSDCQAHEIFFNISIFRCLVTNTFVIIYNGIFAERISNVAGIYLSRRDIFMSFQNSYINNEKNLKFKELRKRKCGELIGNSDIVNIAPRRECITCMISKPLIRYGCGHAYVCAECTVRLDKNECPNCRKEIDVETMRIATTNGGYINEKDS